jgi:hypothetical protein
MTERTLSSKTSVLTKATRRQIPEDGIPLGRFCYHAAFLYVVNTPREQTTFRKQSRGDI